jgi:hypothetical protein
VTAPLVTGSNGGARPRRSLIAVVRPLLALVVVGAMVAPAEAQRRRRGRAKPAPAPAAPAPAPTPVPKPDAGGGVQPGGATTTGPVSADAGKGKPKVFDFTGLDLNGRLRTPQLLYFLDRASEELERASLERRSFIPEMVNSIDESAL